MRNQQPIEAPVEILIVTHAKDFGWLTWALRCARRYLSGFQGITVAHPLKECETFAPLREAFDVRLFAYHEVEGKGMLHHMIKMAEAELIVPRETEFVLHLDADCMFHTTTIPEDYFQHNKPVYLIRTWDSLTTEDPKNPGSKVVSDCLQWRGPTEKQLGFHTSWYTMCRHPTVLPVRFYQQYRRRIEQVHGQPFYEYMLSGRNEFPQDRMDWTAMGAYCRQFLYNDFYWVDVEHDEIPKDRQKTYWSHGGITAEIQREIEGFLA